jgi:hypothetical protein
MSPQTPRELFSCACHALWSEAMVQQGWTYGPQLDAAAKKHPALAPFEELCLLDRRVAHDQSDNLARELLRDFGMDRERGTSREFTADELREGERVAFRAKDKHELDPPVITGTIVWWELEADPRFVHTIRVRWDDGEEVDYAPTECELTRLAELDPTALAAALPAR